MTLLSQLLVVVAFTWAAATSAGILVNSAPTHVAFIDKFLCIMEGTWAGAAVVTPVGPRPYDITFVRTASSTLSGAAHPGASTHYWTFFRSGDTLRLRFLSTFRGNRQPIQLEATQVKDKVIVFRAQDPGYLELHIEPRPPTTFIRIFLRNRLHVEINLQHQETE